jgi:hypothetical protein
MFALSISIFWLPVIVLISAVVGFLFRSYQIAKCKKRILSLETEMLSNHAEILKLQQELVNLKKEPGSGSKTRIVTMNDPQQQDERRVKGGPEKRD